MISSTPAHGGPFASLFDLIISSHPVSFLGGRQARHHEPSAEELTAHLAPHLRVDIGLLDPHTAGLGAGAPTSQPLIPPTSAMHRRGDWGGQGDRVFSWPLRV